MAATPNNNATIESTTTTAAMTSTTTTSSVVVPTEELAVKALHKRYESLVMVKNKAIKGKGAWYWQYLEPILVINPDTNLAKSVKLRCSLCDAVFSASNPSRTASEHLKRATCPNFNSTVDANPISSLPPINFTHPLQPNNHNRKRPITSTSGGVSVASVSAAATSGGGGGASGGGEVSVFGGGTSTSKLILSGGKEDLNALDKLNKSVKKLKSPNLSFFPTLGKAQIDASMDYLLNWVYESCGSVSFSSLEHPKFKAFLDQVGLPRFSKTELLGSRLDAKYEEVKVLSEVKIRDALFFQVSSDNWKAKSYGNENNLVNLSVNLPNGTSLFRKALFTNGYVNSKYAEDVLWDIIIDICGNNNVHRCVGIVSDKFKAKALKNLEIQHPWMVNFSCLHQSFVSLIKDFGKELPLFKNVAENCLKLANFVNNKSIIRHCLYKYRLQEYGHGGLLRVPYHGQESVYGLVEDILSSSRAIKLLAHDDSFKIVSNEDIIGREIEEMVKNAHFWNEVEAVNSLVKVIKTMSREIEREKPRIGECIPLWKELRSKVRDWCVKYHIPEGPIEKVILRRFNKNYHPAMSAAYILDPLYLIKGNDGKYLPPFKYLTPEQEKDVNTLVTRLVNHEEAPNVLMELMKWRTHGLDPVYAQAVQLRKRDPLTGKLILENPQSSRLVWETELSEFKSLRKVAIRLIFLNASSCGFKCDESLLKSLGRGSLDRAQKLIFVAAHSKMERRDYPHDEDKDSEIFALAMH